MSYRKGTGHCNADGMSRCVSPWDCQCNEVDTMEPLKCGPCKRCEKRAIEMKSTLLMGYLEKSKEAHYQSTEEGKYRQRIDQVTHFTKSVGPLNNGRNNELQGELTVTSGIPDVDGYVDVESGFELSTMPQIHSYIVGSGDDRNIPQETEEVRPRVKSGDTQGLVSLRAGTKTVETNWNTPNRDYDDREKNGTKNNVQSEEKVRAVETRSKGKQGEGQLQDYRGQAGRNSEGSAILPVKVILSNYTDNDLALRQKEDPDIEFIYESMLRGRKRPTSSDTVTKSPTARHY